MLRRVGVALLLAAALAQSVSAESPVADATTATGTAAGTEAGSPASVDRLAIVAANVSPELVAAHEGFVEWLRMEVASAGVPIQSGVAVRRAVPTPTSSKETERVALPVRVSSRDRIAAAASLGGSRVLLVDLRRKGTDVEAVLRLHDAASSRLIAAQRASGPFIDLAPLTSVALAGLLSELSATTAPGTAKPVAIADFAVMSRALRTFDSGNGADAWEQLAEVRSATAAKLQTQISAAIDQPRAPLHEKARLLSAQGDADAGWQMIEEAAKEQLASAAPNAEVLLAAGHVASARGDHSTAVRFLEKAEEVAPARAEISTGLAYALEETGNSAGAVEAFGRARTNDPQAVAPVLELARLAPAPADRAAMLIEAGDRASAQLDTDTALLHYEQAIEVDAGAEAKARQHGGDAHALVGDADDAVAAYERSVEAGGPDSVLLRSLARAHATAGAVEKSYARYNEALGIDDSDPVTLRELGMLYADAQRSDEALPLIENATAYAPFDPNANVALGNLMRMRGENERALEHFKRADSVGGASAKDLQTMAAIELELGSPEAAKLTLERAVDFQPEEVAIREDLVAVYETTGDEAAASEHRAIAGVLQPNLLAGASDSAKAALGTPQLDSSRPTSERFAALLASFGEGRERVALLGTHEKRDLVGEVKYWAWPWVADLERIESELLDAIASVHGIVATPRLDDYLQPLAVDLQNFDSKASLAGRSISDLNIGLATDAVFAARVVRKERGSRDIHVCGPYDFYEVELRLLDGFDELDAAVLANVACLPNGVEEYAAVNPRALILYAIFTLMVVIPFMRGWGRVVVKVKLPPKTKALFALSLSKKERKLKEVTEPATGSARFRIEKSLRSLNRYERPLEENRPNVFTMIPARKKEYYLTVRGPLLHYVSNELVGNFLESRRVKVVRGRTTEIEFDLEPTEAAIEVSIVVGGERAPQGVVTVAGRRDLTRYARDGSTFLYLAEGEYTLVVSDRNHVSERLVSVYNFDPQTIEVDLSRESEIYFEGCPPAAMHYLEGDYAAAADCLERDGQETIAHEIRARWLTAGGRVEEATAELEAAGQHDEAARLRASHTELGEAESGQIFEQAGDFASAAVQYQAEGDYAAAARAFEAAYDYDNAIECYRGLGETEKVIELLERTSDYLEAGKVAYESNQLDRAIYDLQQCDKRHLNYSEVCRLLAQVLIDRGELDVAAAKIEESFEIAGVDSCPLELHERYAGILQETGRLEDALQAWEAVRHRDLTRVEANTRIESIRKEISQIGTEVGTQVVGAAPVAAAPPAPVAEPESAPTESRYEVLAELGRGGMGVVYKARDTHLGRVVALKQLTENLKDHPSAVQFFEREARSAAVLNHPNIVTVYDAGQENGAYFISMEFMEGTPLDEILKKQRAIKPAIVARLATQICAGLDYAHRNKIIHRDIKTANLFFTKDKIVKIMDFGLAKMVEEVRRGATVIGGTPYYMAPEQADGENVDHRADLYALGVTFFQMLSGAVPFAKGDVTYHHRHTPAPDVRELNADVPAVMAEAISKLMEKDPAARIQTAGEVGRIFQTWIESGGKS